MVDVRATGLCRSDWHAWAGHENLTLPHVPGHELAGVVESVGAGVTRWTVGDRVTVPFVCGCGRCAWCRSGNAQVCPRQEQPGFTYWGSFAEYVALPAADTNLVALPESVSFAAAASLGCRFATAYRALTGRAGLSKGEWLTVVGAGGVGLSAVMIGKALGANVIAIDRTPGALAAAEALGPTTPWSSTVTTLLHGFTRSPAVEVMSESTRWAMKRRARARSSVFADAAGMCRWVCYRRCTVTRVCPWIA